MRTRARTRSQGSAAGLALALAFLAACAEPAPLRVAAPADLRQSGLLEVLLDAYAGDTGVRPTVVAEAGPADLRLGPGDGPGVWWIPHVVLGPPEGVRWSYGEFNYESWARGRSPLGTPSAIIRRCSGSRLLAEIRLSGHLVVSRGDGSATHRLELRLWGEPGPPERADGYVETGESMAGTLAVASERSAYALSDLATYLRLRRTLRLAPVLTRDDALHVSWEAALAEGAPPQARQLRDWLRSERARDLVREFRVDGERAFYLPGEELPPTLRGRLDPEGD